MPDMDTREPAQAFKVRFRDPRTRAALQSVAQRLGVSMNELADLAIEHELLLRSAFVATDLEAAAANLRALSAERHEALLARSDTAYAAAEGRPEALQGRQLTSVSRDPLTPEVLDSFRSAFDGYPLPGRGE